MLWKYEKMFGFSLLGNKKTLKQDGCKATLHFSYYNIWWRLFLLDTCFSPTNTKSLWKKMNPWNISKTLCKTLLFCDLQIYYKYISRSTYYIYRHGYRAFWQGGGNIIWIRGGGKCRLKLPTPTPPVGGGRGANVTPINIQRRRKRGGGERGVTPPRLWRGGGFYSSPPRPALGPK